jgi:O-antigen/teichoic acid export membrane protein
VTVIRRLAEFAEFDRSIADAIATRAWSFISGPISLLIIAKYLSPDVQGYYYTFFSLLALQIFVELAFSFVINQFASHEWAHLHFDERQAIAGEPRARSRLISLGRFAFKWFAAAGVIFVAGVSVAGYRFFSKSPSHGVVWQFPWLALVAMTGIQLGTLPMYSLLEGCNQISASYRFKLAQAIIASLALWGAFVSGWGLWAAAASSAASSCVLIAVFFRYRRFFGAFRSAPSGETIHWKEEIWPMQWRLGMAAVVNYFMFNLFTPVMFRYHGAAVAGQMGMTWSLAMMLQQTAGFWITTKMPRFGILIAKKDYKTLDGLFIRSSLVSLTLIVAGALGVWLLVVLVNDLHFRWSARILPPLPTGILLLASVLLHISACQSAYLRAHKREPLLALNMISSVSIGLLVWYLGKKFGPLGACSGYLAVIALYVIPYETYLWRHYRALWHGPRGMEAA